MNTITVPAFENSKKIFKTFSGKTLAMLRSGDFVYIYEAIQQGMSRAIKI